MRLVYAAQGIEIPLEENRISTLYVEHPTVLAKMVSDMWAQFQGEEGGWNLSKIDQRLDFAKETECVFNLFDVGINGSKIVSKIHKEMTAEAMDQMYMETEVINSQIIGYLAQLTAIEDYALEYDLELDVAALLKAYHVRFVSDTDCLAEKLVEYAKVMRRILNKSLIVFLGLKQFVSKEELERLCEDLLYEKLRVLFIEGQACSNYKKENKYILDKDLCIIKVGDQL